MTGRAIPARAMRLERHRTPFPTAVIVPVLGRPHRVVPFLESLEEHTPEPWLAVFVCDDDDDDELDAVCAAADGDDRIAVVRVASGTCYAAKINAGVDATGQPVLFQCADDVAFHPEWLGRAQARISERRHVVGTNDLYNPRVLHGRHSTHTVFTREYVERWGTIDEVGKAFHEGYPHAYCDDEFVQTARSRRMFTTARDAIVEHLHPFAGKAETDWVYLKGRGLDEAGRRVYDSRRHLWARHFGP